MTFFSSFCASAELSGERAMRVSNFSNLEDAVSICSSMPTGVDMQSLTMDIVRMNIGVLSS